MDPVLGDIVTLEGEAGPGGTQGFKNAQSTKVLRCEVRLVPDSDVRALTYYTNGTKIDAQFVVPPNFFSSFSPSLFYQHLSHAHCQVVEIISTFQQQFTRLCVYMLQTLEGNICVLD